MLAIAAQTGSTQPQLIEVDLPGEPDEGQVLCRTLELGVCGTDREILHSAAPWTPPGEDRLILGHECLARIEAVGAGVTDYQPGDLVVPIVRRALADHVARDSVAESRHGVTGYASRRVDLLPFGAFTERGIVREHGFSQPLWLDRPEHLFRVPESITDLAVLTEPLAISEKGVNEALVLQQARLAGNTGSKLPVAPSDAWTIANPPRVLVTGMGPIGFTAVLACVARGWTATMLGRDEPDSFRARLVARLGGLYQRLEQTDLRPADIERDGYDLLLECTGSDAVMVAAASLVRSCGVIIWLGSSRVPQPATHNLQRLMRDGLLRNHIHLGCVNAAPRDFHDALAHLGQLSRNRRAELTALITARVRPAESLGHYEHRHPQGIKTVLMYS